MEGERDIRPRWPLTHTLGRDRTHSLGMCPNLESDPKPSGSQNDTPANWATLARAQTATFYLLLWPTSSLLHVCATSLPVHTAGGSASWCGHGGDSVEVPRKTENGAAIRPLLATEAESTGESLPVWKHLLALVGGLSWLGCHPTRQKVVGSIPSPVRTGGNRPMSLPPLSAHLPPSPLLPPLSLKPVNVPQGEDKQQQQQKKNTSGVSQH